MDLTLPALNYRDSAQIARFYDRVLRGLETLSGIEAAEASGTVAGAGKFRMEGRPEPGPGEPQPNFYANSPRYLEAMRIPILRGRSIAEQDGPDAPRTAVLSESIARHYWPGSNPIGH